MLLLGLSCAWLLGNHVISQMTLGGRVSGVAGTTTMASSAAAGGAASSNGLGGSPALDPKEYKKEELPEKSIKTFNDVKGCDESKAELQVRRW
jgi:ATP-dependent metalloprotease